MDTAIEIYIKGAVWSDEARWVIDAAGKLLAHNDSFMEYPAIHTITDWRAVYQAALEPDAPQQFALQGFDIYIALQANRLVYAAARPDLTQNYTQNLALKDADIALLHHLNQQKNKEIQNFIALLDLSPFATFIINNELKIKYFNQTAYIFYQNLNIDLKIGDSIDVLIESNKYSGILEEKVKAAFTGEMQSFVMDSHFLPNFYPNDIQVFLRPKIENSKIEDGKQITYPITELYIYAFELTEKSYLLKQQLETQNRELLQTLTELKYTQNELLRQKNDLNTIFNAVPILLTVLNIDFSIRYSNQLVKHAYFTLYGKELKDGQSLDLFSVPQTESLQRIIVYINEAFLGKSITTQLDVRIPANSPPRSFYFSFTPTYDARHYVDGVVIACIDLQNIVSHQIEVEKSKFALNAFLNASQELVIAIDRNYKIVYVNQKTKDYFADFNVIVYVGIDYRSIIAPSEWDKIKQLWERTFSGEQFTTEIQYRFEGFSFLEYRMSFAPIRDENGNIQQAVIFAQEITEYKQVLRKNTAQIELARSQYESLQEARRFAEQSRKDLERLINSIYDPIVAINNHWVILYFNDAYLDLCKSYGFVPQVGKWAYHIYPKALFENIKHLWQEAFNGESIIAKEFYLPNGKISNDYVKFYEPLYDEKDEIYGAVLIMRYMKDYNQALSELQQSKKEIKAILDSAEEYIVVLNTDYTIRYANEPYMNMLSTFNIVANIGDNIKDVLSENLLAEVVPYWERVFKGEKFSIPYLVLPDNEIYSGFYRKYCPLYNEQAEIDGGVVFIRDISNLLTLKNAFSQKEQELISLLNALPEPVLALYPDWRIRFFNSAFHQLAQQYGLNLYLKKSMQNEYPQALFDKIQLYWEKVFAGTILRAQPCFGPDGNILFDFLCDYYPIIENAQQVTGGILRMYRKN